MSSASISIAHLSWTTPDGHVVFEDLNLDFGQERAGLVGRNGVGKSTLFRLLVGGLKPASGTVSVRGTIGKLHQIVQISAQETVSDLLGIAEGLALLRKAEAGIASIEELAETDWTLEERAGAALARMGLDDLPLDVPLIRLSGGQRTRVALAGALRASPDFLLLDEPTNNLDRDGRRAVRELLDGWRSGAIVVSHDRELLETMDAIVELTTFGASRYGGNWSHYRERKDIELAAAGHDLATAERRAAEVARKAQLTAERQQRRDAVGSRRGAKGGMPRILLGGRRERAENNGGNNRRQAERQRSEATRALSDAKGRIEQIEKMSIELAPSGLSSSRVVLALDHVTAGYDGGPPILNDFSLRIVGPERIAIMGANGSGKSTLLRLIAGDLPARSGTVALDATFAFFDQRVSLLDASTSIAENFARLNPGAGDNGCRAALARFRFRADAADRQVNMLSGGMLLRAGLACVLGSPSPPALLILDEPTNHLDIESIEAVEAALNAYDGALLIVSHDAAFLQGICLTRSVAMGGNGDRSDHAS